MKNRGGSTYNCVLETKPVQIFSVVENIVGGLQVEALLNFGEGAKPHVKEGSKVEACVTIFQDERSPQLQGHRDGLGHCKIYK